MAQQERIRRQGFLSIKNTVPSKLNDKVAEWKGWKEDTLDFMDTQFEGLGKFLSEIVGKYQDTDESLKADIEKYTSPGGLSTTRRTRR